jgi:hypothetical protein
VLRRDTLRDKLLVFCDASDSQFNGFPTTRDQARDRWASAFDDYLSVVEEQIPRPPPPVDTHPSLALAGVKGAFRDKLQLVPIGVAATAALDLAGAWQAGVLAVTPGGTATDSAGGTYVFVKFVNASTLHDTLTGTLTALFLAPSIDTKQRITDIAGALHTATKGLIASVTYTSPSSATSTITIGLQ